MSQRRALQVVVSNRKFQTSQQQLEKLPTNLSTSSANTRFESNMALLRRLKPAYVDVIEKLVDDAVADLDGRRP